MKQRVFLVVLSIPFALGCHRKPKAGPPIGAIAPQIVEIKVPNGAPLVRITTKARAGVSVSVVLDREGPLRATDSCFIKEGSDSCSVEMSADQFRRYPAEIAAGLKPFPFIVEASADGVPSVKKELTWERPASCTRTGNSLDCVGLDVAPVLSQRGLELTLTTRADTLTLRVADATAEATPAKPATLPIDGRLVTIDLLRKAMSDRKQGVYFEVPIRITKGGAELYRGGNPISVGFILTLLDRSLGTPMPWAAANKRALYTGSGIVGEATNLLDIGLYAQSGLTPSVEVPCGTYKKAGPGGGTTKEMTGGLETKTVVIRELRTGKEVQRKTLTATGNPCLSSGTAKGTGNKIGFISLSSNAFDDFYASAVRR